MNANSETVIVATLFDRVPYIKRMLNALTQCDGIDKALVILHAEPGYPEVVQLARTSGIPRLMVVENQQRLGCSENVRSSIDHGFQYSDFVISLEDDVLIGPDCLHYFKWAKSQYQNDPNVFSITGHGMNLQPDSAHYYAVKRIPWFVPFCWGTWRDRWSIMMDHWYKNPRVSWDINLNQARGHRVQIESCLARAQNIGAHGTHVPSASWHMTHQFNPFGSWSIPFNNNPQFFEIPG